MSRRDDRGAMGGVEAGVPLFRPWLLHESVSQPVWTEGTAVPLQFSAEASFASVIHAGVGCAATPGEWERLCSDQLIPRRR